MNAPELYPESPVLAPSRDRLVGLVLLMALLHAILLLGITFGVGPQAPSTRGMEVILTSDDLPEAERNDRAAYTAQRTQLGAGNTRDQPTSSPDRHQAPPPAPAPAESALPDADDPTLASTVPSMAIRYLGSVAAARRPVSEEPADDVSRAGRGDGTELVLRGDPNTGRWLSPDTQGSILAPYLDQWRRKIERLGTLNYPTIARDHRGAPIIEVALRYDGVLEDARVQGGSGDAALDQAALNILKLASPFNPFPPELAAKYRIMRFAYQWQFVTGRASGTFVTSPTDGSSRP